MDPCQSGNAQDGGKARSPLSKFKKCVSRKSYLISTLIAISGIHLIKLSFKLQILVSSLSCSKRECLTSVPKTCSSFFTGQKPWKNLTLYINCTGYKSKLCVPMKIQDHWQDNNNVTTLKESARSTIQQSHAPSATNSN